MYRIRITTQGMSYLMAGFYDLPSGKREVNAMRKLFPDNVFIQLFRIGEELPTY